MARVYPPSGSALLNAADATHTVSDDFDLRVRSGMHDVGAYERDASGLPAWVAVDGFKGFSGVTPGSDAGPSTSDAGTDTTDSAGSSCGCRVGQRDPRSGVFAMLALGLALVIRRKRAR